MAVNATIDWAGLWAYFMNTIMPEFGFYIAAGVLFIGWWGIKKFKNRKKVVKMGNLNQIELNAFRERLYKLGQTIQDIRAKGFDEERELVQQIRARQQQALKEAEEEYAYLYDKVDKLSRGG